MPPSLAVVGGQEGERPALVEGDPGLHAVAELPGRAHTHACTYKLLHIQCTQYTHPW